MVESRDYHGVLRMRGCLDSLLYVLESLAPAFGGPGADGWSRTPDNFKQSKLLMNYQIQTDLRECRRPGHVGSIGPTQDMFVRCQD